MPELWLNYGSADVVLDVKVENLNTLDNAKFKKLEEEIIDQQIASIPLENTKILALGKSKSIARIISLLLSHAKKKGDQQCVTRISTKGPFITIEKYGR